MLDIKTWHVDDFWVFEPVEADIYSVYHTNMLQQNQENLGTSWESIIFVKLGNIGSLFRKCSKVDVPFVAFENFSTSFFIIKCEDKDRKW